MFKYISSSLLTIFFTFTFQNVLASEMIPTNAVKASSVISMIQSKGYHNVFDFDYHHGMYKVKAVDKDNEIVKITVNATTNEIMHVKDTECHAKIMSHPVSMLDAARKVEWHGGVKKIYDIDFEHGAYEVIGFNVNDRSVEYLVDYNTGKMVRTH